MTDRALRDHLHRAHGVHGAHPDAWRVMLASYGAVADAHDRAHAHGADHNHGPPRWALAVRRWLRKAP